MRIEVLTFLRFVAAVVVVVFHFAKKTSLIAPSPGFLTAGPEMVSFFFVLSGFVMVVSHWNRVEQPLAQFYWARFARIAPIYFLALGATLLLASSAPPFTQVLPHLLFLQAWLLHMPITLNITGWSISVEVFFYAVFPFALSLARHPRWTPRVLLVASLGAWTITQVVVIYLQNAAVVAPARYTLHELIHYFPVLHLCSFLLGVMGGAWFLTEGQARGRSQTASGLVAGASLVVTYLVIEYRERWWNVAGIFVPTSATLLAPLFLWVIIALARSHGPVARFFSRRPFVVLGEASFALYILQFPVQMAYVRYVTPGPLRHHAFDMEAKDFLSFAGCLLALSIASLYLFERPMRRLLLRLVRRPAQERGTSGRTQ
jgi:peptidoglycan/LPS O-acetylase OafA/YrhL